MSNEIGITMSLYERIRKPKDGSFYYPLFHARIRGSSDVLRLLCLSNKIKGVVLERKWSKLKEAFKEIKDIKKCLQ